MPDAHYDNPLLAELYDLNSGWSPDRDYYLSLASGGSKNILDLGCGTGLLCNEYAARGHNVTGVDPSPAMLNIARRKPHGEKIEWVQDSAQTFRTNKRFDLIIMTGHAFQVLLTDDDVATSFSSMRKHLKPDGNIAFEARNPLIDWPKRWNYEVTRELEGQRIIVARRFLAMNGDQMTFEISYRFPHETLISTSVLAFHSKDTIEKHLSLCNLRIKTILGGWSGEPFDETTSEEMIFTAQTN